MRRRFTATRSRRQSAYSLVSGVHFRSQTHELGLDGQFPCLDVQVTPVLRDSLPLVAVSGFAIECGTSGAEPRLNFPQTKFPA